MIKSITITAILMIFATGVFSQVKPRPRATPPKPVANTPVATADKGTVVGRTYTNSQFGFEITFPDTWLIPDDDFEAYMRSQGFDLSLKAPDSLTPVDQTKVNKALKKVSILLTAYRSMPGSADNAIVRISTEDLSPHPQIKDAVDYFDAIRATFKTMKLPADFKFSETNAEKLGTMQFAYLDTATKEGKKRMYATVRKGHAIMISLSYTGDEDLLTLRHVLEEGNFNLRTP